MGAIKRNIICECEKKHHAKGKIRESCKYHERRMIVGFCGIIIPAFACVIMLLYMWVARDMELWVRREFGHYFIIPLMVIACITIFRSCCWMDFDNLCNVQKEHHYPTIKGISCKYCYNIPSSKLEKMFLVIIGIHFIVKLFKKKSPKLQ